MDYHWYPGHMTKARRMMEENIKIIDLVIELTDARVPLSGRNPDIDQLARNKARMILLNKSDLADPAANSRWKKYFQKKGAFVVELDARKKNGMKEIQNTVQLACKEKIERDRKRGIINRPVRAMVVGIPNVGKSTFINTFSGKASAKTGNKPGVTKGKQWIKLSKSLELLDTPGILWPRFDDPQVGLKLAIVGTMNDQLFEPENMACSLIEMLKEYYPGALTERYQVTETGKDYEILQEIAKNRKCLLKGEEPDIRKAAVLFMDDFRSGRLGRLTLELPEENDNE